MNPTSVSRADLGNGAMKVGGSILSSMKSLGEALEELVLANSSSMNGNEDLCYDGL
jgi:hypothetical protein